MTGTAFAEIAPEAATAARVADLERVIDQMLAKFNRGRFYSGGQGVVRSEWTTDGEMAGWVAVRHASGGAS